MFVYSYVLEWILVASVHIKGFVGMIHASSSTTEHTHSQLSQMLL